MAKTDLTIALVGQPNCGKSTLFNAVAGFKVNTGNFSGTTVSFTETKILFEGKTISLIDLPGAYSLSPTDLAEKVTRDYILNQKADIIINVVDSSLFSRSLELTLQVAETEMPMLIALNMFDEAEKKGISFNLNKISELTGIKAIPVVSVQGIGITELFQEAIAIHTNKNSKIIKPTYDRDVEETIAEIIQAMPNDLESLFNLNKRFLTIRLLEIDDEIEKKTAKAHPEFISFVREKRKSLAIMHDWPEESVFASHRHAAVLDLYEKFAKHASRKTIPFREKLDRFIMNPLGGLITIVSSLIVMFFVAFKLGDFISTLIEYPFERLNEWVSSFGNTFTGALLNGFTQGLEAGVGIVLPYLVPLLVLMALFEDTGILPRIAFMIDGLLHRFGLHGKAIVPFILGYGCSVPAIMATRNLENTRDRMVAMLLVPFIACSARTVVILAITAKYLGAMWAGAIYVGNIVIVLILSFILSKFNVNLTSGIVMDVPPLRKPYISIIFKKVWLRLYEFIVLAWPIIIVSSMVLAFLSNSGADVHINNAFSLITENVLHLPKEIGIALFLGIMRKELALVMLESALKTKDISSVLSPLQMITLVTFTTLYIPCVASLATLWKEGGFKIFIYSTLLSLFVAILVSGIIANIF